MMNIIQKTDRNNKVISVFTPSINVEKFKQQAKKIKKEQGLPHHEALDLVAQKYKYHHWHHVTEMAALTEPTEKAYRQGLLIAFDMSNVDGVDFEDTPFKEAEWAECFCKEELWKNYLESAIAENLEEGYEEDEEDIKEDFTYHVESLVFCRYTGKRTPANLKSALKMINKHFFWLPDYVWLKGNFYNTSLEPSYQDGKVVAVRF